MGGVRVVAVLGRGLRLRCPRCGGGRVFDRVYRVPPGCAVCGLVFEREPGYFVGAIYLNYGVTVLTALAGYFALDRWADASLPVQLAVGGAFTVVFPLWFFRHSKGLWLALDYLLDPADRSVLEGDSRA